ncbi:MAG: aldehyde ferredoxin oxidoreductase family protein [Desulfobacteraceae bacterium]|nr:aldehyde ferredoxin oxidoreductase family protein [Desulfobacteraceae bacterium]
MQGYTGKMLRINLTDRSIETIDTDMEMARNYLGGSGFCTALLADLDWGVDPLSPGNRMVFATGPLTGAPATFCSRYVVAAKSPLTGIWGEAHASGFWGPELKFAGWDAVILDGAADSPVYLSIEDGEVEIRDAGDLWGRDILETEELLRERHQAKKLRVLTIGPAGEKLSFMASIANDHRAAARTGLGAVMGSKNLKAITVRGTLGYNMADGDGFKQLMKRLNETVMKAPARDALHNFGTDGGMMAFHDFGDVPIKNWSKGEWSEGAQKVSGAAMSETILTGKSSCRSCLVGCGRVVEVKEGPYAMSGAGPEYETAAAFGPMLLNDNLEAVAKANDICNRSGMDTISTGATIAFAMECYEKGLLSKSDTDGLDLTWGNHEAIVELTRKIGEREGFGAVLADGSKKASEKIGGGSEKFCIVVKGLELPMHDPRAFMSWAVNYATVPRGGCHMYAPTFWLERGLLFADLGYDKQPDRFATEGKGVWTKIFHDYCEILESLVICKFSLYANLRGPDFSDMIRLATGWDVSLDELLLIGERIINAKRLILNGLGITRKDDTLPERILNMPHSEGGAEGHTPDLAPMLDEYYRARGWDENGVPTPEKLESLGLR